MARYKLVFRKSVSKDLRGLSRQDVIRVLKRIEALAEDPRPPGCEKLSRFDRYRIRQGIYRVIYEIDDLEIIVTIVKVAHRRNVYRHL